MMFLTPILKRIFPNYNRTLINPTIVFENGQNTHSKGNSATKNKLRTTRFRV
jgi:hypothetical protein